jgi:macrolide-specific efflux system membrane fusion protein
MQLSALLYGVILFAVAQQPPAVPGTVIVDPCILFLDDEAKVPAQEPGVLMELHVKDGQNVKRDEPLAKIDDSIAQQQVNVAENELRAAKEQADNQVPRDYAIASRDVAYADLKISYDANKRVPGSVVQAVINKQQLECKQMELSILKAESDTRIALKQMEVKKAQKEASVVSLNHRQICAPLDGQIRKTYRHVGEWIQAGEPVVHIVRMDRLRVEGSLLASEVSPNDVTGKPVTVEVFLTRERTKSLRGKIVFVDPMLSTGGEYLVRAEVENSQENGQWILQPGLTAKMTIQLK